MRSIPRWLPPVLVVLAVAGLAGALGSLFVEQAGGDWYRDRLGGSTLYTLNVAFARLLPFLLGFGVALALLQRERRRNRAEDAADAAEGERVVRHGKTEVATHWLNAAGMGLGLITGALLLQWFGNPLSLDVTYVLHFLGAGLTVAAVAHHVVYHVAGGGTGLIPRSWGDVKDALAELVGYLGVFRGLSGVFGIQLPVVVRRPLQRLVRRVGLVPEPAGKYLATEKVVSYPIWAVLIGVLVLTGIVKSVHYVFALPGGVRQAATFLHSGATIFVVIFLAIHVGALVLVPRNWPLLASMFTTRISRAYAQRHLPRWLPSSQEAAAAEPEEEEAAAGAPVAAESGN